MPELFTRCRSLRSSTCRALLHGGSERLPWFFPSCVHPCELPVISAFFRLDNIGTLPAQREHVFLVIGAVKSRVFDEPSHGTHGQQDGA